MAEQVKGTDVPEGHPLTRTVIIIFNNGDPFRQLTDFLRINTSRMF